MPIPPADPLRPGRYRLWLGINLQRNSEREAAHMAFRGDINAGPVEIEISDKDDPLGTQFSEAVKENGAEFQTVTRTPWSIPAAGAKSEVQLGLKVTNRTSSWMQINVFDTIEMVLTDEHGAQLRCVKARDATFIPEPLILEPREGRSVHRNATLEWSEDGKSLRLIGSDAAGANWHLDDLKPGKYTVHFVYENNVERLKSVLDRPAKHVIDPKEAAFWMGKVTTKDLPVETVEAPDRRSFSVKCRKDDDAIQTSIEGGATVLSLTSPSGIGGATVERNADHWPETVVLRIHFRGLESLSIACGDTTLRTSVTSHSRNPRLLFRLIARRLISLPRVT